MREGQIDLKELSKSIFRRLTDVRFATRFYSGVGIDIGGKPDPLSLYSHIFPLIDSVMIWDLENGDAQYMHSIDDETFDFVNSSHTLEHMLDPQVALSNWIRITKKGGYLVLTFPDEDLYEQGPEGPRFNIHHKTTFSINKTESWSQESINVISLLQSFSHLTKIVKIELIDHTYDYGLPRYDQTRTPIVESAIEVILYKLKESDIVGKGELKKPLGWDPQMKHYYDLYIKDQKAAQIANPNPFGYTE